MSEETQTEATVPQQEGTVTTPQAEAPALTVADLRNLRTIIDISSQRGAFKGPELGTIGSVFDKLDAFLKSVDAKEEAQKQAEAPAEATAEEKS
tara:strand:- start:304 stop:585 length:282 start_codon:yes stop_codon:yes gene_type:complete